MENNIGNELLKSTHLLIGGTTGCGKSVLINDIVLALLNSATPDTAAFVLIDPKRVELSRYKRLPFTIRYAQEPFEVIRVLSDTVRVMENRYKWMEEHGLTTFSGGTIYIIIDELADLMISPNRIQIRLLLQKILQLGRAARVSVIAATQAPNRRIIPAELVLNFTDRIALRCLSPIESRQIIGMSGAENLPKYGTGLYLNSEGVRTVKITMATSEELQAKINYWKMCKNS